MQIIIEGSRYQHTTTSIMRDQQDSAQKRYTHTFRPRVPVATTMPLDENISYKSV